MDRFQLGAMSTTAVAALGSVGSVLYAGRNSPQHVVLFLMAAWVISPYVALVALNLVSKRWAAFPQRALHGAMLLISVASLIAYGLALVRPLASKPPAFVFVIVPPASLVLAAIILAIAWWLSRQTALRGGR